MLEFASFPDQSFIVKLSLSFVACFLLTVACHAAENWPDFRGPSHNGVVPTGASLPLQWSESQNIRWKTEIPGRGWSTPVIWGDQVWMTSADEKGHELFAVCVDRESGKLRRRVDVFTVAEPEPINPVNSYASPSPVIEEGRLYVYYGTYGVAAIDTNTAQVIWKRNDFKLNHKEGPGSSPILFEDLLIFHVDGMDVQYVVSLHKTTGELAWKTDRSADLAAVRDDFRKAYSTPLIVEAGAAPQLVSTGAHAVYGYDPRTGKELWRLDYNGFSNVSRPVFSKGLVFINTGYTKPQLWALKWKGGEPLTEEDVLWRQDRSVGVKPSLLAVDGLIYMISDKGGVATCLDATTGTVVWTERLGGNYSASPVFAQGRIYFFDEQGEATVIAAGRTFQVLARNQLDDGLMASPAAADASLFLRTKSHLYCVQE